MLRLVAFAFLAVAAANVIHDGKCPGIKPVENFNVSAYQGLWYEISKFATVNEENGKCGTAEYTLDGEVVKLKNSNVVNGVLEYIEGSAKLADDAEGTAKLVVTLNFGALSREMSLSVVATDYTNYAVAYNCKYDEANKSHSESVWVLSRTKTLEGEAKAAVDNFFSTEGKEIDTSKLVPSDFSEEACKYSGTSVVSVRPKA